MLLAWTIVGFLYVFLFPAKDRSSQWFQMVAGGPVIWVTMFVLYRKQYGP